MLRPCLPSLSWHFIVWQSEYVMPFIGNLEVKDNVMVASKKFGVKFEIVAKSPFGRLEDDEEKGPINK